MPHPAAVILAMNRTEFTTLWVLLAVLILAGMWWGWRSRSRRDAGILDASPARSLCGEVVAQFPRVGYVSTTPADNPLERVALPGLRYKGWAEVAVYRDGVEITVVGEAPVQLDVAQIRGVGAASGRVGKAVERDGLALLRWLPAPASSARPGERPEPSAERLLESAFRFADAEQQSRFGRAVEEITDAAKSAALADGATQTDSAARTENATGTDSATQTNSAARSGGRTTTTTQEDA